MRSSTRASDESSKFVGSQHPHVRLYSNVKKDFQDTKADRSFSKLWSKLAPQGNIYRYLAAQSERRKHCIDVRRQLVLLADEQQAVLGASLSAQERFKLLLGSLAALKVERKADLETEAEIEEGFLPIEEFANDEVAQFGPFIYPTDPEDFKAWRFNRVLAIIVCLIQILGPFLIIMTQWQADENQLKDPAKIYNIFSMKEVLCPGTDWTGVSSTIVGTLFLILLTFVVRNYITDELENAEKLSRLPVDIYWSCLGTLSNGLCCLFLVFALPLEYFAESSDGPTAIIMNSMALMFIFTLDDLASDIFGYIGDEDSDFQRKISWYYSLLSNCPVNIGELINPNATTASNLWQINFDDSGRLLSANANRLCLTRIAPAPSDESSPLKDDQEELDVELSTMKVLYRTKAGGHGSVLPSWTGTVKHIFWTIIFDIVVVMQIVGPVFFFVFNQPCTVPHSK